MDEIKLIALYYYICGCYDKELRWHCQRFSPYQHQPFTDCEVLTVYLYGLMYEEKYKIKSIWSYAQRYLHSWFPQLPSYQAFNQRLNRLSGVLPPLLAHLSREHPAPAGAAWAWRVLDAFPIMTCSSKRAARVARALVDKGFCATKNTHYYGLKLHVLACHQAGALPRVEWLYVSAASEHDLTAVRPHFEGLRQQTVCADKCYADSALEKSMFENQGVALYTPVRYRRGQTPAYRQWHHAPDTLFSRAISSVRQPIEAFFNWLIERFDLQNASRVRSTQGLLVHVFGKLVAAFATLLFNP
jgi:hypothetical protein